MPHSFKLLTPIHGISADYGFKDEPLIVQLSGFYSTEDGQEFITIADNITNALQAQLTDIRLRPSMIDNLLVIIDRDCNGLLYHNELAFVVGTRLNRDVKKGEGVYDDDVLDIEELRLAVPGNQSLVDPPKYSAVIFVFSSGWRKGLYFNFSPIHPFNSEPLPDLAKLFGTLFCRLRFQEKYHISEAQWNRLAEWEWFPFSCLTKAEMKELVGWSGQTRYPEEVLQKICASYKARLPSRLNLWKKRQDLDNHGTFIDTAYDAYLKDNHIASIQTIMPRIEGLMRMLLAKQNPDEKISQAAMVKNLVKSKSENSLLLPIRFRDYLLACYFKGFDLATKAIPLSRHTVGHGVSKAEDYTFMRNTLLFMILDEIFNFLPMT